MWSASPRRIHLIDRSPFALPDGPVGISTMVRNLRAHFDECMSMETRQPSLALVLLPTATYQIYPSRFVDLRWRPSLTNSFIIARVDYCSSIRAVLTKPPSASERGRPGKYDRLDGDEPGVRQNYIVRHREIEWLPKSEEFSK